MLGLVAVPARAQEPDAGTRVAARELALSGAEAFDAQDFATALDRFQRAESLYKVPSISVMVARCLARLGRVVEAVDKYEETLRTPLDASAPEAFQRAVADAETEVETVRARVARIELFLPADAPPGALVRLDEKPVPKALLGVPTPVNPGHHQLVARAPGCEPFRRDVELGEGGRQSVRIVFATAPVVESLGPTPARTDGSPRRSPSLLSIGLLTGGGISLAVGTLSGIAALGHKSKLDERCSPGCPAELSSDLDAYRFDRALSYVTLGVGVVSAGAGAYLWWHQSPSGARVGARVFPGGAELGGRF